MRPLVLLLLAACAAPDPVATRDVERTDARFSAPPANRAEELLKKEEFTLEDALAVADLLNPTLEAERKNIDLATAAMWEASIYPNASLFAEVEELRAGSAKRVAGVTFPLVVSGRLGDAEAAAASEREAVAARYLWRRREILSGVKAAFVGLLVARQNLELAKETRDIAKKLHAATEERYKAQAVPEMEVLKAAVNLARSETEVRSGEKDAVLALKSLHALMGDPDFPKDRFRGELHARYTIPSLEALRGQVLVAHPLLEAAKKSREAAERLVDLAKAERLPDLGLSFAAGVDAEDEGIFEGGIEIPIPLFNRNQAKIAAAEIRVRQAELELQAARNGLLLRLTEAWSTLAAAQDRVAVFRETILPKAKKALDQTDEGYVQGKFGLLDLLDAQRTLAEANLAYTAALDDLNQAAVELEKLTGTKLEPIR